MKLVAVTGEREEDFYLVESGSTFVDRNNDLFLKITPTCDAEDADNAVNLKVGYGCKFDDEEKGEQITKEVKDRVLEILSRHEREDDLTRVAPSARKEIENIKYIHGCVD